LILSLADYIERSAAAKMRAGMSEKEARRAARIELGGVERVARTLSLVEHTRGSRPCAPYAETAEDVHRRDRVDARVRHRRQCGLALGAPAGRIPGMVLKQVARMAAIGVVLGTIAAWALGLAAQSLLLGVEAGEPVALAAPAALFTVVMLGAAYIPARRASRVDPMTVLRYG
jgi:hypothetical protein